jgi:hypothetical protein
MNLPHPHVEIVHLDPVRAEIVFSFNAAELPADAEIRGKMVGPRCAGVSTVEVAYPLKPVANRGAAFQVIIPEPSLWEPQCPYIYDALLEFWHEETCLGKTMLPVGLRVP